MKKVEREKTLGKRLLKGIFVGILSVLVLGIGGIYALWHNEIGSMLSLQKIRERNPEHGDGAVYMMNIKGGFYLDEFVEQGGVESDQELIEFATNHITKGLFDIEVQPNGIGCSGFWAKNPEGDVLWGRNDDWIPNLNTCIIFTEANAGRHASISTARMFCVGIDEEKGVQNLSDRIKCLGLVYALSDGMNDAGVCCGVYSTGQGIRETGTNQNTDRPDTTGNMLMRMILDYADNVEEAVALARSYDLHEPADYSYHYMVTDSSGKSVILEWVGSGDVVDNNPGARELVVTYNDDDAPIGEWEAEADYQWITNFIIQPDYYDSVHAKGGYDRYEMIYEELSKAGGVVEDEWAAMDILAMVSKRNLYDIPNAATVYSVVYNLTDKKVLWVSNENYEDESAIFEFSLE